MTNSLLATTTPQPTRATYPPLHVQNSTTISASHHLSPPRRRVDEIGDCRNSVHSVPTGNDEISRSITYPQGKGVLNVTVGGGPVGVPLPIGDTSDRTGPFRSLLSEACGAAHAPSLSAGLFPDLCSVRRHEIRQPPAPSESESPGVPQPR
jgi:hypothetical protein